MVEIGGTRVDLSSGVVSRSGHRVTQVQSATLSVLDTLAYLSGEAVLSEALIARIWPAQSASESGLAACISEIREALGGDRFCLETVPGRGYRLQARLVLPDPGAPVASVPGEVPRVRLMDVVPQDATPESGILARGLTHDLWEGLYASPGIAVLRGPGRGGALQVDGLLSQAAEGWALSLSLSTPLAGRPTDPDPSTARQIPRARTVILTPGQGANKGTRTLGPFPVARAFAPNLRKRVVPALVRAINAGFGGRVARAAPYRDPHPAAWWQLAQALPLVSPEMTSEAGVRARGLFQAALRHDPDLPAAWIGMAMLTVLDLRTGGRAADLAAVCAGLARCLSLTPDDAQLLCARGRLRVFSAEWEGVAADAMAALRAAPHCPAVLDEVADLLARAGSWEEALQVLDRTEAHDPHTAGREIATTRAMVLYELGKLDDAARALPGEDQMIRPETQVYRAIIAFERGERAEAASAYAQLKHHDPGFDPERFLARCVLRSARTQDRLGVSLRALARQGRP